MDLLDILKEKGIVKIITNYLDFFYHVDKNKRHTHHIKFKNVLSKINYNYMKNKKVQESDLMLLYLLKDYGFINISYKECLTMSSFHVMDDIRNRLVDDQRQLNNYYQFVWEYRNRNRNRLVISPNLRIRHLFFDEEGVIWYIYGHDKRVNAVNKLENKLGKKRKIFLKKNYKRDITKENRDLLIRRIQSKLKSRKLKNLEKSKKIRKDLLKNKKTNRRYR